MQQTDGIKPNFHAHITLFIEATRVRQQLSKLLLFSRLLGLKVV